jgi:hypothetical protein
MRRMLLSKACSLCLIFSLRLIVILRLYPAERRTCHFSEPVNGPLSRSPSDIHRHGYVRSGPIFRFWGSGYTRWTRSHDTEHCSCAVRRRVSINTLTSLVWLGRCMMASNTYASKPCWCSILREYSEPGTNIRQLLDPGRATEYHQCGARLQHRLFDSSTPIPKANSSL